MLRPADTHLFSWNIGQQFRDFFINISVFPRCRCASAKLCNLGIFYNLLNYPTVPIEVEKYHKASEGPAAYNGKFFVPTVDYKHRLPEHR